MRIGIALLLALIFFSTKTMQAGERFVVVDSFYTKEIVQLSLDAVDLPQSLPDVTSDVIFSGFKQSPEQGITPLRVVIAQEALRNMDLVADPNREGVFRVLLGNQPMLTKDGDGNLSVWLEERFVPERGDEIRRLIGRSTDGRFIFSSTDDLVPAAIVVVIAGLGLACGVVYVTESWREDCGENAIKQCGEGNIENYSEEALIGFKWRGGVEIGCGKSCEISCRK